MTNNEDDCGRLSLPKSALVACMVAVVALAEPVALGVMTGLAAYGLLHLIGVLP